MKTIFISPRKFINLPKNERWKVILNFFIFLAALGFLFIVGMFLYFWKDLPSPGKINSRFIIESTKIYDRTGNHLLYEIHGEEKRTQVSFKEMPENIRYATIALEDQDFYSHHGIKMKSIIRAAFKGILKRSVTQGGSTITQQFVKNSLLTPEKTFTRKIKEVILAIEMELKFSKDEILEMYLNEIPYGSNAYGIEAATQTFFGKKAIDLTLDEAALLAALPKAPTFYSPYGSNVERLKIRQEYALTQMTRLGYISEAQAEEAKKIDVLAKIIPSREKIFAPHFVMYVKEYLELKYGKQVMEQGGLRVYTTLDWNKQEVAEKILKEEVEKNIKNWNAYNASLVAINPKNGHILAMVGSKDFFGKSQPENCITGKTCKFEGQVNVAIRDRQPGSSFKPYVYLTAFKKGYTPETYLFDAQINFATDGQKDYIPQNYDGKFRGPVKMKEALGQSLNVPAVQTLYLAGIKNSILMAKDMGITGLNYPDRYGLSLVLGGGEVKLLDHVDAFSVLANNGIKQGKTAILRIQNNKGEILEEYQSKEGQRIVEEKYVAMINHILSNNDYREPVFGSHSPLRFDNRSVAVKTGTTNEFRDGWTIGYTPSLVVGVWAGNNDNSSMRVGADGVNVAAPIWRKFFDKALENYSIEQFSKYEKEETGKDILDGKLDIKENVKVCKIPDSNDKYCLANEYCGPSDVKKRNFADVHSILWYVKKDNPRGDYVKNPEDDPQFKNWEKAVQKWYEKNKKEYIFEKAPTEECKKEDFEKYLPSVDLQISKDVILMKLNIKAKIHAPYGKGNIDFFIQDKKISSGLNTETSYFFTDTDIGSQVEVKVKLTDKNGNEAIDSENVIL